MLVATEDVLSETVARKLLEERNLDTTRITFVGRKGAGHLKMNMRKYLEVARQQPVLVLTDLDETVCAPSLVNAWLGSSARHPRLLLRVAIREVEAWLMADRDGFAEFLSVPKARIERDVEAIADPKRHLLRLAERAPSRLRRGLLPSRGAAAIQGFEYNPLLCEFVAVNWSSRRAAENSQSLSRLIERLGQIQQ